MALSYAERNAKLTHISLTLRELSEHLTLADRLHLLDSSFWNVDEGDWAREIWRLKCQLGFYHSTSQRPDSHHEFYKDGYLCKVRTIENHNRALG